MRDRTAQLLIRPFRDGVDDAFIQSLGERAFSAYSRGARGARASMVSMLSELGAEAGVAEIGRAKVGFAILGVETVAGSFGPFKDPAVVRLNAIAVRADSQGRGVGRGLLVWAEERARALGGVSITLTTAETNLRARRLFELAGFLPVTRLPDTYVGGQTGIAMFKSI
jgi:ribosomal protein S18 acetylase RimI-like enzyme